MPFRNLYRNKKQKGSLTDRILSVKMYRPLLLSWILCDFQDRNFANKNNENDDSHKLMS